MPYLGPATGLERELKVNEESKLGNPEIMPALVLLLIQSELDIYLFKGLHKRAASQEQ